MATVFQDPALLNWPDGADLGLTTATIGLLCGIFGGMIIINYSVRKKYTKIITEPAAADQVKEIFVKEEREPAAYLTVSQDVVEPFAFHLGIIGIAILMGQFIVWGFGKVFTYTGLPLFPFAMIGGWILNSMIQKPPSPSLRSENFPENSRNGSGDPGCRRDGFHQGSSSRSLLAAASHWKHCHYGVYVGLAVLAQPAYFPGMLV